MAGEHWQAATARQRPDGGDPFSQGCRKIVLLIDDDRLVLSHFQPLLRVLQQVAQSVVVVAQASGRHEEIEATGTRVVNFDFQSAAGAPLREAADAWSLARIIEDERPDVVHLVGTRPILLGGLALKLVRAPRTVLHMTGLEMLSMGAGSKQRLYRAGTLHLLASLLRNPGSYLLVETLEDLARLRAKGLDPGPRFAILGGVGVDPVAFDAQPLPHNSVPVAAFVGRLTPQTGIEVLIRALGQLKARGVPIRIDLFGSRNPDGSAGISETTVRSWRKQHNVRLFGQVSDVREIWRRSDIFVLPALSREGIPRALLEAAACARPLIVTSVPGCRHFVRDGVDGLVVPPDDAEALANALERVARDGDMRERMGQSARLRLLQGYTENHVKNALLASYQAMLARAAAA